MTRAPLPTRRPSFSVETVRRFIAYDPASGFLTWKERQEGDFTSGRFSAAAQARIFNAKYAGKPALNRPDAFGYRSGNFLGKAASSHRFAWAIYWGEWPNGQVDHINGDARDNRIENLRDVSPVENSRNIRMLDANTSGNTGVYWMPDLQKWRARICANGKSVSLGCFKNKGDAISARMAAQVRFGFSDRHGKATA